MKDERLNNLFLSTYFRLYGAILLPLLKFWKKIVVIIFNHIPARDGDIENKILINFGEHYNAGIGDAILLNTLIKMVRHKFPKSKIYLLIHRDSLLLEVFWKKHSGIDVFMMYPPVHYRFLFSWLKLFVQLKNEKFSAALICTASSIDNVRDPWFPIGPAWTYTFFTKTIIGYYDRWNEDCFFLRKVADVKGHWTNMAVEYARALDIPPYEFDHFSRPWFPFQMRPLPNVHENSLNISINHGGGRSWNRMWPFERFVRLCIKLLEEYDCTIYLLGGTDEFEEREELLNKVKTALGNGKIFNVKAQSLNETANYISRSQLFIGNDSGPTHLATGLSIPVVAIFGPSDSQHVGPQGVDKRHRMVSLSLECQPCENLVNRTGTMDCFRTTEKFKCLTDLSFETVWTVVQSKIEDIYRNQVPSTKSLK